MKQNMSLYYRAFENLINNSKFKNIINQTSFINNILTLNQY